MSAGIVETAISLQEAAERLTSDTLALADVKRGHMTTVKREALAAAAVALAAASAALAELSTTGTVDS